MHLEINAGGLSGGIAIAEYQLNMSNFLADAEAVISSFQTVSNATYSLCGGAGSLQSAAASVSERIRIEEEKLSSAQTVRRKTNDFLDLAIRIDNQVAAMVTRNQDEFYRVNPWLKPAAAIDAETPWYERAWGWLCGAGAAAADEVKEAWSWVKDTAKKAWDGLVEFYQEHKKIIDTILIAVGAIAAIAAVILSGGTALVPLLGALGLSVGTATAISTAVAVIAVVSTAGSALMNITDIWMEIDNPVFNFFQKALTITSVVTNLVYSIGNIYNSIKHITPQEYIDAHTVTTAEPTPTTPIAEPSSSTAMFDNTTPVSQDTMASDRYFARGNHYDEYQQFWESGGDGYTYSKVDNPQVELVKARDIEGVSLNQTEMDNPAEFWNKRYSKADYVDYVTNGNISNNPVEVTKVNDSFYYFEGDGRHRILTAQELDIDIPVIIKGLYTK